MIKGEDGCEGGCVDGCEDGCVDGCEGVSTEGKRELGEVKVFSVPSLSCFSELVQCCWCRVNYFPFQ